MELSAGRLAACLLASLSAVRAVVWSLGGVVGWAYAAASLAEVVVFVVVGVVEDDGMELED